MQDLKQLKTFLDYLAGTQKVEVNNLQQIVTLKDAIGKPNIYFCGGIPEYSDKRCSDDTIKRKRYFFVDIDIRSTRYTQDGVIFSDETLFSEIEKVRQRLIETGFGDYYAMVFSGNGVHFYYTGEEIEIDKVTYSHGVQYIYSAINEVLELLGYKCDSACHNIARISRLPGSINTRVKKKGGEIAYDMGEIECYIMDMPAVDCDLLGMTPDYAKEYDNEQQIQKIVRQHTVEPVHTGSIRDQINKIDISDIANDLWGVELGSTTGDNVPLKESHKNMGAYVYKPYNILVNTGSSLIKDADQKTFTPYQLVLSEMMNGDKKATVEYFKSKHGVYEPEEKKKGAGLDIPEKKEYESLGYVYGHKIFDEFECLISGELVIIVAEANSGKTTFAMDMIRRNKEELGLKGFYINLEFNIAQVAQRKRLERYGKTKKDLTLNLGTLTPEEKTNMENFVLSELAKFSYYNNPNGANLQTLVDLITEKNNEGYGLFVIDSFSRIEGNISGATAHASQNKTMEVLQALCQNLGIVLVVLHHTNKTGKHEGSQKIKDLANIFMLIEKEEAFFGVQAHTVYTLTKDKFVTTKTITAGYERGEYIPL